MQKNPASKKLSVNRKLIAALTLLVALVLTFVFVCLGMNGRKLDKEGLFTLLPWLPVPGASSDWQKALEPGADLGDTTVLTLKADQETEPSQADLENAAGILVKRLQDLGWMDAAVQAQDGAITITLPKGADAQNLGTLLSAKGEFTFADPAGAVFMDGTRVVSAAYGFADQSGRSYALSLVFDDQGKQIFGDKSIELLGQSISVLLDGKVLVSPGIQQALTDGMVTIPVNSMEEARDGAILLRSGPLPFALKAEGELAEGTALLGKDARPALVIALAVFFLLVALYFIITYRLGGLLAAWMLLLQLALSYFFAALMGRGFTLLTLAAIYAAFLVSVFALLNLYKGTRNDLVSGRSIRQSVKDAYATQGHISLDIYVGLLLVSVVLIIADKGLIGIYSQVFALGLLVGLVLNHLLLRVLFNETITLFGGKDALYAAAPSVKKEA